jgi:hypothetical protein
MLIVLLSQLFVCTLLIFSLLLLQFLHFKSSQTFFEIFSTIIFFLLEELYFDL